MTARSSQRRVVRLTGWKSGIRTIDLALLVRDAARVDLRKAKKMVEEVLDGGEVTIHFANEEQARAFWSVAEPTGVLGDVGIP